MENTLKKFSCSHGYNSLCSYCKLFCKTTSNSNTQQNNCTKSTPLKVLIAVLFCCDVSNEDESRSTHIQLQQLSNFIQRNDKNGVILWLKTNNVSKQQVF